MTAVLPNPASLPRGQQERRQRIIKAAITLLETGEYDAIQMRDVAERAGVALATIYRYFTSKEHLYAAAIARMGVGLPHRRTSRGRLGCRRRDPAAGAHAPGRSRLRTLPADDASRDRARELERHERARAVGRVRRAEHRDAHHGDVVDRSRDGGRHRRRRQRSHGDPAAVMGARPVHHPRRRQVSPTRALDLLFGAPNPRPRS